MVLTTTTSCRFQHGGGVHILQRLAWGMAEFSLEQTVEVFLVREAVPPGDLGDMRVRPSGICQRLVGTAQPPALYLPHDAAAAFEQLVEFCPRQADIPANPIRREIDIQQMRIDVTQDPLA